MPAYAGDFYGYREADLEKGGKISIIWPTAIQSINSPPLPDIKPANRLRWWQFELVGPIAFDYEIFSGEATDDWGPVFYTEFDTRIISGTLFENSAIIRFFYGDTLYQSGDRQFDLSFMRLECVRAFQIKNAYPGLKCRYEIMFMR